MINILEICALNSYKYLEMNKLLMKIGLPISLVALGFLGSCGPKIVPSNTENVFVMDDMKNGQAISVEMDKEISLVIEGNITTGYDWNMSYDSTKYKLELMSESHETIPGTPKDIVGAPSNKVFKIKAKQQGEIPLRFFYARGWEKGMPPANELNIKLIEK